MKKIITLCALLFASVTNASIINDFTGDYAVANWDQSLDGGSIDLSGAPLTIAEISSDAGNNSASTDFTIAATGSGLVSFDWSFTTADDNAGWDPFGWLLNGTFTQVTNNSLSSQSGSVSFLVNTGDIFGFSAKSLDGIFGSSTTVISNFSAPSIPEPSSLAIIALALVSLSISKRKKSA